ncbi:hypothetical protein D3C72_1836500 [compost metagenome]
MLGDQQVPGTGDRQEFGKAFEDAQQEGGEQIGHRGLGLGMGEIGVEHKTSDAAPNVCVVRPLHHRGARRSAPGRVHGQ